MKRVIVLVMHGVPPSDFPREETREFFRLQGELGDEHGPTSEAPRPRSEDRRRYRELEGKMRAWPRNAENDPYHAGSQRLAEELRRVAGLEIVVAFNEFCGPSVDEALDQAVALGAEEVVAITPMMTAGGEHSEVEIPQALERAKARAPRVRFTYAWPFEAEEVAGFLAGQISHFVDA
jgi:sirohydrochlorin cobaltochelatase